MTLVTIGIILNVMELTTPNMKILKNLKSPIFAKSVENFFLPFQHLSAEQCITFEKGIDRVLDGALNILPDNRMRSLLKNLNNLNAHDQEDDDDDYQIGELKQEIVRNGKFSLLHLNIASLGAHKDEFEDMLSILDLDFDILGLTETRIIKEQYPTYDTSITGYKEHFTPTESTKGGTSLYINKNIESKERTDLDKNLYIPKKLESTFVELIITGKKNIIIGCIYKHPKLDINEFNILFENTMEKLSFENKELYLLQNYNIDLLQTPMLILMNITT